MSGLPTLRVRESIHIQKIREYDQIIQEQKNESLIFKQYVGEISIEDVEKIRVDIDILNNLHKKLQEQIYLKRIGQKIRVIQRERLRVQRISNLTVNVEPPPTYEESVAGDSINENLLDLDIEMGEQNNGV